MVAPLVMALKTAYFKSKTQILLYSLYYTPKRLTSLRDPYQSGSQSEFCFGGGLESTIKIFCLKIISIGQRSEQTGAI